MLYKQSVVGLTMKYNFVRREDTINLVKVRKLGLLTFMIYMHHNNLVFAVLRTTERKMQYQEYDLKTERTIISNHTFLLRKQRKHGAFLKGGYRNYARETAYPAWQNLAVCG